MRSGGAARRRCRRSIWSAISAAARSISPSAWWPESLETQKSGKGQVVDAAMVDGAASLMTAIYGMTAAGVWNDGRGENILDTGAHYYDVYETRDGKYVSIGSIETKFYEELLQLSGLKREELPPQNNRETWPAMKQQVAAMFRTKTRDEWCKIMEGSDICFAPVLSMAEAPKHPHNRQRGTFVEVDGVHAAGAGAALQPHAQQYLSVRQPARASIPKRHCATGASAHRISRGCVRRRLRTSLAPSQILDITRRSTRIGRRVMSAT